MLGGLASLVDDTLGSVGVDATLTSPGGSSRAVRVFLDQVQEFVESDAGVRKVTVHNATLPLASDPVEGEVLLLDDSRRFVLRDVLASGVDVKARAMEVKVVAQGA